VDEKFSINESVATFIAFFGLGVTKDAAKPNCLLPIEDNGSSNAICSSGEVIIEINEAQL
jgi:hypothetical protein